MENKYKFFLKNIEKLESKQSREHCLALIERAQIYYSYRRQYLKLIQIKSLISYIYDFKSSVEKGVVKEKTEVLSIEDRLFLEFYRELLIIEYGDSPEFDIGFYDNLEECEDNISEIFLERNILDKEIDGQSISKRIKDSCEKAMRLYSRGKKIELGMKNIFNVLRIYKRYKKLKMFSKEKCFTELFSDAYIQCLVNVMNNEVPLLGMHITPVLRLLCDENIGGSEIDTNSWSWCFNIDLSKKLSKMKCEIAFIKNILGSAALIKGELEGIIKQIKTDEGL